MVVHVCSYDTSAKASTVLKTIMVSSLRRVLFPILLAVIAVSIGKYSIPFPNLLKLLITPVEQSNNSNNDFGLFVLAAGMNPVIECVNQLHICNYVTYPFHLAS
jgi:hypothetical protein